MLGSGEIKSNLWNLWNLRLQVLFSFCQYCNISACLDNFFSPLCNLKSNTMTAIPVGFLPIPDYFMDSFSGAGMFQIRWPFLCSLSRKAFLIYHGQFAEKCSVLERYYNGRKFNKNRFEVTMTSSGDRGKLVPSDLAERSSCWRWYQTINLACLKHVSCHSSVLFKWQDTTNASLH